MMAAETLPGSPSANSGMRLAEPLVQERANAIVHQGFDLRSRQSRQHVIPPSTTSVCPVMNEAWSEARKNTAFATYSMRARRPSGVRRAIRSFSAAGISLTMSLSK